MDPVAPRHPDSDDPSDTDLPPAASPGPAVPDADGGPDQPRDTGLHSSASPIALVAHPGRIARLFMSGYSAGPTGRRRAGHAGLATALRSSRSGTPTTRSATATRAARSTAATLVQGAIKGMIDVARRPVLAVPVSPTSTARASRASAASSRGSAPRSRRRRPTERRAARRSGPACRLVIITPLDGSPAEQAGLLAGDLVLAVGRRPLDGLTVDGARDARSAGPKGSGRHPRRPARRRDARRARRSPATSSSSRRSSAGTSPTGRSATSGSPASRTRPPTRSWRR